MTRFTRLIIDGPYFSEIKLDFIPMTPLNVGDYLTFEELLSGENLDSYRKVTEENGVFQIAEREVDLKPDREVLTLYLTVKREV